MTIAEVRDKVRAIMNEAGEEQNLSLLGEDTVRLDAYIESVIPDALNLVLLSAPVRHINTSSMTPGEREVDGACVISLPADFLRLAAVRITGWKRSEGVAYPFGGDAYKTQHNPVTRSGVNKPACVLAYDDTGPVMECFPSGTPQYFHYVRSASNAEDGLGLIKDGLFPSLCYMCASLVYDIFENPNTGERMKAVAMGLIPKE